jgi:single-stranded DNA-binding protein
MSDINSINLTGRLTADPGKDENCTYFTIAVNTHYKVKSEWKCRATYAFCKAWGFLAKKAEKLSKGQMVALLGTLESYAKEGQTHLFVNVRRLMIIPGKKKEAEEELSEEAEGEDIF